MNDQSEISHSKQFLGGSEQKEQENTIINSVPIQNQTNLMGMSDSVNMPSGQQFFQKKKTRKFNDGDQKYNSPRNNISVSNLNQSQFNSRDNETFYRGMHTRKKTEHRQRSKTLLLQTFKVKNFASKLIGLSNKSRYNKINKNLYALIDDRASYFTIQSALPQQKQQKLDVKQESCIYTHQEGFQNSISTVNLKNCFTNSQVFTRITEQLNKIPVISPTGTFKFIWDLIMMVVIVSYFFMIPIELTFYKSLDQLFPNYILLFCNIALLLDFVLQWNLGYFEKGLPNMNRIKVMAKYFKSQIYLDITSSFFLVIGFFTKNDQVTVLHLLFFLRFKSAKLFFKKLEERFNLNPIIMQLSNLIQLLLLIVTVSHIIGCVWISVSHYEYERGMDSWISEQKIDQNDWLSQYIHAYYYSTVTMITVGYGDFRPINPLEMTVSIMTMLISCGVFAYSINAIGTIFNSINQKHTEKLNNLYTIGSYMAKKNINFQLQIQIKEYLEYYWEMQNTRDMEVEQNLISQLSPHLKERLMHETFKMIIQDYSIFRQNFSEQFIMEMISVIQECSFRPEEVIVSETKDEDHCIYFIESGKVALFVDEDGQKVIKFLKKGDMFGDLSFFTGQSINLNAKAIEFTSVFTIKRSEFLQILQSHPIDHEIFCNIQDNLIYQQNYNILNTRCYLCYEQHPSTTCNIVFPVFNKMRTINLYNKSEQQQRDSNHYRKKYNKFPTFVNYQDYGQKHIKFVVDYGREIDLYYINYILQEDEDDEDDDEDSYSGDQIEEGDEESGSSRSFNIYSQQTISPQPFENNKNKFDRILKQSTLMSQSVSNRSKSNLDTITDMDEKESPLTRNQQKQIKASIFNQATPNHPSLFSNKQNLNNQDFQLPTLNLKKVQSQDSSLSQKRNLIKIQQIQTNFNHSNSNQFTSESKNSPLVNSTQSPSKISKGKLSFSKQSYQKTDSVQLSTSKDRNSIRRSFQVQQVEQTNLNQIAEHIQQLMGIHNNKFKDQNDNQIENDNFDVQKNFEVYLPHNNLTQIIEYLKFKQKYLKQLKASMQRNTQIKQLIAMNNIQEIMKQKNSYLYQYPFNTSSCNRNFQILRVFERKIFEQQQKKKLKNNLNQHINSLNNNHIQQNKKGIQANTRIQRLVDKFEYISAQEVSEGDTQSIHHTHNNSNQIADYDYDEIQSVKKNIVQQKTSGLVYKQSSFYHKNVNNDISINNIQQDPTTPHSQLQNYFEKKRRFSTISQTTPIQNELQQAKFNFVLPPLSTNQSKLEITNREENEDIDSPLNLNFYDIHQTQNIKPKNQYFNDDSDAQDQSPEDSNRRTLQQELKLNSIMKSRKQNQNTQLPKRQNSTTQN